MNLLNSTVNNHRFSTIKECAIGIGLRSPHHLQILTEQPPVGWLEIHSENFFQPQSQQRQLLDKLAEVYPLSFHGIGLSLGSTDPVNKRHLALMKELIDCYQPALISEHLSWSSFNGQYFNDLLPVPYTTESLTVFCDHLNQAQNVLGRQLLVENPTTYLTFADSEMPEWEFMNEIQRRCQSGILLDLNNIYVNSINLGFSAEHYLAQINLEAVQEIHLAGFTRKTLDNGEILIDTHGSEVSEQVWQLFRILRKTCQAPALIEWDTNLPPLEILLAQAARAEQEQIDVLKSQQVSA